MSEEIRELEAIENKIDVPQDQRLSSVQVSKIIEDFDQSQYLINEAYYKGENPSIKAKGVIKDRAKCDPNNIIPLPFARKTINDLQGYAFKPGNVTYQFDEDTNPNDIDIITDIFRANDEPLISAEEFQDAAIKGEGAELMFFKDGLIQFGQIPREECIFEFENTIKENVLSWAIRFYSYTQTTANGQNTVFHRADIYFKDRVDFYEWQEQEDKTRINQQEEQTGYDSSRNLPYVYLYSELHPFGEVPLYPARINSDRLGIYQPAIPIIDKMDELGSDSIANAIDQFNDTILALSKKVDEETAAKIKELKIIDGLGGKEEGNFVEFLQRNLDIESTLRSTELFERWYYELTGIPNLNDEKFNVKSGIAIAYALTNFENLVTSMEIYFTKFLQYRLILINNALIFLGVLDEPVEAELQWARNLPFDLKERTEIAAMMKREGLLSDETILKVFPGSIVPDPQEELEKKRQETSENFERQQQQVSKMINENKLPVDDEDNAGEGEE